MPLNHLCGERIYVIMGLGGILRADNPPPLTPHGQNDIPVYFHQKKGFMSDTFTNRRITPLPIQL